MFETFAKRLCNTKFSQMGTFSNKYTYSDAPKFAADNTPLEKINRKAVCLNCSSSNTYCVYEQTNGSIIGWYSDAEFFCPDCGKYSQYCDEYDS